MPLYEGLGSGGEKTAVVIDLGEAFTKCGFAGETGPRCIIPSEIKKPDVAKTGISWKHDIMKITGYTTMSEPSTEVDTDAFGEAEEIYAVECESCGFLWIDVGVFVSENNNANQSNTVPPLTPLEVDHGLALKNCPTPMKSS